MKYTRKEKEKWRESVKKKGENNANTETGKCNNPYLLPIFCVVIKKVKMRIE
jgi:hypothetical protein